MTNTLEFKNYQITQQKPTRANEFDSGLDLYVSETITIPAHTTTIVKTDIAINLPYGYEDR